MSTQKSTGSQIQDGLSHQVDTSKDLTGRDRLFANVLWGWGSYFIVIIIGFIMPRLIDRKLGQVELGIWDFSWSLVSYLSYSSLGIGASVNRYVAKFRAVGNVKGLCTAVSSVTAVQLCVAFFISLASVALFYTLPFFFREKLSAHLEDARWVVLLLGFSLAVNQSFGALQGVISGCHRWDIHNGLNLFSRVLAFFSMLIVVIKGMGLFFLALAYFGSAVITSAFRIIIAFNVCPELQLRPSFVTWSKIKEMFVFGWKSQLATLTPLLAVQTINVIIVGVIGPASLAVLARCIAFVNHMSNFANRFSFVTTTTSGALQERKEYDALKKYVFESSLYGVAITLPIVLILVVFGKALLLIWMGKRYISGYTIELLAIGYFLPVAMSPILRILIGLNKHGVIGLINFVVVAMVLCLGVFFCSVTGWTLDKAAIIIGLSLTLSGGIIVPVYACKILQMSFKSLIMVSFNKPILCNLPFFIILFISRFFWENSPVISLASGLFVGGFMLIFLYLFLLFPEKYRKKALASVRVKTY